MVMDVSVVICCFNSEERITETLRCLALQEVSSDFAFEVIVVNNASSDKTTDMANAAWKKYYGGSQAYFRVVNEPIAGLTHARMAGMKAASSEIIIFCDDDNHFAPSYVERSWKLLGDQPETGIVGGIAKPKFSIEGREWLQDFFISMAVGPQAPADGYVKWVYGAGMVIRKKIFHTLEERGIRLLLSDRSGKVLTSGGDSEICSMAIFLGFNIYYSSDLILLHDIPGRRLEKKHYLKARMSTVSASVYLSILDTVIQNHTSSPDKIYRDILFSAFKSLFYFLPRAIIGKHRFYSFFMFYRTGQTAAWLLLNSKEFKETHHSILVNLQLN